jgi:hypothetical protein
MGRTELEARFTPMERINRDLEYMDIEDKVTHRKRIEEI